MFRITSQLTLCGKKITDEEMLEKTFSTFHASNMLLQQQYRERGFKKYCDLISCLLVAEQNNELLMKTVLLEPPHSQKRMWQHIMIKEKIMDVVGVMVSFVVVAEAVDEVAVEEVVVEDILVFNLTIRRHMLMKRKMHTKRKKNRQVNMDCLKINDEDICLVDSGSTHTVLKKKGYFSHLTPQKANISTISGVVNIIEGFGKAHVLLPGGTNLNIENAFYSPKSQRNLLNFKDIRKNGYHIETMDEGESEYLLITNISSGKKNEPLTGDLFTARFADCHFDESEFPALGGGTKQLDNQSKISWSELSLSHLDPRTKECELEVQRIIHLQGLANQLPDTFTDPKRVTMSHVPAANAPIKIDVPKGQNNMSNESRARLKRGRPLGSKDKNPRKKKGANNQDGHIEVNETPRESPVEKLDMLVPEEPQVPENEEISINYNMSRKVWNRDKTDVDDTFAYNVALNVMENEEDQEPKSVDECMHRKDWPKWKDAMQTELNSLTKREVFGPVVRTPEGVKPVGYKWVFVRKRNEKNEIVRYKARLVAQGFSQRPGIDYEETYSPVVDATTFRYLISLIVAEIEKTISLN
ncbi:hypothetical protein OSB04_012767 [Centaurea solstitialis]|uniref:Reverse transcriptase Ty1/copia-type domain-containing protein n=1 Tax=Centaurea solstitialis TaxID=347529 RepID=A0AA38TJH9_9ASTR|nr:hypothetical protein OSB04_012767 [Centaurea solstitialis]